MNNSCYLKPKVVSNTMRNNNYHNIKRSSIELLSNSIDRKDNHSIEYANNCLLSSFEYNPKISTHTLKNTMHKKSKSIGNNNIHSKINKSSNYIAQLENEIAYQRDLINSIKTSLVSIIIIYCNYIIIEHYL
jgi:hypothetical protein